MLVTPRVGLVVAAQISALLAAVPASAQVYDDGRDAWTLLPRKLINRNLFEQLEAPGQETRLGRGYVWFAVAADSTVSGQIPVSDAARTRFHGYFVLDTFTALRPFEGLDLNLNVTLLNPSASDGYRVSSEVLPGVAIHLQRQLAVWRGEALRLDLLVHDLDLTTVGIGLLLEEIPLEGYGGSLTWAGFRFQTIFAGRVFWYNDDLWVQSLSALDGALELYWAAWLRGEVTERFVGDLVLLEGLTPDVETFDKGAHIVGLAGQWEPLPTVRLAAEVALRLRTNPKAAAMVRVDYLERDLGFLQLHVGYQARFYQQGFGPNRNIGGMLTVPNVPDREDAYVTNSFEMFAVSKLYDQWSHTLMVEGRADIIPGGALLLETELWIQILTDPRERGRVVYLPRGGRAPGVVYNTFYRTGVEIRPWLDLPHRLRALFTNKLVQALDSAVDLDPRRFSHDPLVVLEVEVFL